MLSNTTIDPLVINFPMLIQAFSRGRKSGSLLELTGVGTVTINTLALFRIFSELEIERSRRKFDPSSSYAKRWAAKEACSKALGIGLRMGISWKEMHVVNLKSGQPELIIEGKAKYFLEKMTPRGFSTKVSVSLTDDYPWAKAIVIIEGIA